MKILITGIGYIGSVLIRELVRPPISGLLQNHLVTAIDDFRYGYPDLSQYIPCVNIIKGDVRDARLMLPLVKDADVIIPLAAIVGAGACDAHPIEAQQINVHAIKMLCDVASKDQLIVFPNTNSGYGSAGDAECTEESPLNPLSLYGRSKCEAEDIVMQRENSIALRLATVYGLSPRMRTDLMVNDFCQRAIVDKAMVLFEGHFRRNFVHVQDVASAFIHCMQTQSMIPQNKIGRTTVVPSGIYNCGDDEANMTKWELCQRIGKQTPFKVLEALHASDPDKRDYVVSSAKLRATGWKPRKNFDDGIKELLAYFRIVGPLRNANV